MRISELSRLTDVPVPTIKFYLREGLIAPGRLTGRRQAVYDEGHLARIRMIRILTGIGKLSISSVREVLRAVDDRGLPVRGLCEVVNDALFADETGRIDVAGEAHARARVDDFLNRLGWRVDVDSPGRNTLAQVLTALDRLGDEVDVEIFVPYAHAAAELAAQEAEMMPSAVDSAHIATTVVARTVLLEVALAALRRMVRDHVLAMREDGAAAARSAALTGDHAT